MAARRNDGCLARTKLESDPFECSAVVKQGKFDQELGRQGRAAGLLQAMLCMSRYPPYISRRGLG